jgi:hypothetical protein
MDDDIAAGGAAAMPFIAAPSLRSYENNDDQIRQLVARAQARHRLWDVIGLTLLAIFMAVATAIMAAPFVLAWQGYYAWASGIGAVIIGGAISVVVYGFVLLKQERVLGE